LNKLAKHILAAGVLFQCLAASATGLPVWPEYFLSGSDLQDHCRKSSAFCEGYVIGIVDHESQTKDANSNIAFYFELDSRVAHGFAQKHFCLPAGVQSSQLTQVVIKYLSENPKELHKDASTLTSHALGDAFSCKGHDIKLFPDATVDYKSANQPKGR
jgi:hypothetical protein